MEHGRKLEISTTNSLILCFKIASLQYWISMRLSFIKCNANGKSKRILRILKWLISYIHYLYITFISPRICRSSCHSFRRHSFHLNIISVLIMYRVSWFWSYCITEMFHSRFIAFQVKSSSIQRVAVAVLWSWETKLKTPVTGWRKKSASRRFTSSKTMLPMDT